ncbi:toprim domain-containing protein, partial [Primorskyibacter sp. 2E107]|uniref:toprim domain-containing protein n=1 Tax=Primorskyibacter sp. 2E107 TaxID=3403458 RepID=UPI003AF70785
SFEISSFILPRKFYVCSPLKSGGITPGELIIAPDGDAHGKAVAVALATRAHVLGWTVSTLPSPNGLDWNDALTGKEVGA